MSRTEELTDEQWILIEPLLPRIERMEGRAAVRLAAELSPYPVPP